ncbi:MAG: ComEC/Rec2 family competence protein [Candidatus Absconditabacterales bacterium]|nr:ComEC/Rec2 family competence protein [Candidatus Absconditabacterales bacterium]
MLVVLSFVLAIGAWMTGWGMAGRWIIGLLCCLVMLVFCIFHRRPSLVVGRSILTFVTKRSRNGVSMMRSAFFFFLVWSIAGVCIVVLYLRQYAMLCGVSLTPGLVSRSLHEGWELCTPDPIYQGVMMVDEVRRNQQFVGRLDDGRRVMVRYDGFEPQVGEYLWVSVRLDFPWRVVAGPVWQRPFVSVRPVVQDTFGQYDFDYTQWLILKEIVATTYVSSVVPLAKYDDSLIMKTRRLIAQRFDHLFGDVFAGALYAGFLLGDTSGFDQREYDLFRDAGLIHVVAVSGGHIVVVLLLVSLLTRFLPFYLGLGIKALAVGGFVLLAGAGASIMRAGVMAFVSLASLAVGRMVSVYRLLGITSVVMIAVNPQILFVDVGFLLSFGAVIGIVLTGEIMKVFGLSPTRWWGVLLHDYLVPCVGASVGVLPVLLFFMGTWNVGGIVSNILLAPFLSVGMVFAGLAHVIPYGGWIFDVYHTSAVFYADRILDLAYVTVALGPRFEIVSWSWRWGILIGGLASQLFLCAWFAHVGFVQEEQKA